VVLGSKGKFNFGCLENRRPLQRRLQLRPAEAGRYNFKTCYNFKS